MREAWRDAISLDSGWFAVDIAEYVWDFVWKADEARATLDTYFNNSVGIGEHSNLSEEILKWTKVLAESEEAIDTLKKYAENRSSSW